MTFETDPLLFLEGDERPRALASMRSYFRSYTGRYFDVLADSAHPNQMTASDLVAVSMLSVNVDPQAAALLLLGPDTKDRVTAHLSQIPPDQSIADSSADLGEHGAAMALWNVIGALPGVGPTTTSKLLAAKRPGLIPIQDKFVWQALMGARRFGFWEAWSQYMRQDAGAQLEETCSRLAREADVEYAVSTIRVVDIVVWMRVHGHESDPDLVEAFAGAPVFWPGRSGVADREAGRWRLTTKALAGTSGT